MAKLNPAAFAAWLEKQYKDKCGYLMGAVGQYTKDITVGSWLVSQYKSNAAQYAQAKKWLTHAPRVYDCQGLADCYVSEQTGVKTNVYARGNYADWCGVKGTGRIPAAHRTPGAAVFTYSASDGRITHVGFLLRPVIADKPEGDWYVIEARGVMYGVVRTKLYSRSWNRWGLMDKYFDYGVLADTPEATLGSRTLRKGMMGSDVKLLQEALIKLGYSLPKYGADGDFGGETLAAVKALQKVSRLTVDGIYGENTHAALMDALAELDTPAAEPAPAEKTVKVTAVGTWNVRTKPGTDGGIVTVVRQGTVYPFVSAAENGWLQIEINGGTGWLSPKCAEVAA